MKLLCKEFNQQEDRMPEYSWKLSISSVFSFEQLYLQKITLKSKVDPQGVHEINK